MCQWCVRSQSGACQVRVSGVSKAYLGYQGRFRGVIGLSVACKGVSIKSQSNRMKMLDQRQRSRANKWRHWQHADWKHTKWNLTFRCPLTSKLTTNMDQLLILRGTIPLNCPVTHTALLSIGFPESISQWKIFQNLFYMYCLLYFSGWEEPSLGRQRLVNAGELFRGSRLKGTDLSQEVHPISQWFGLSHFFLRGCVT